MPKIIPQYFEPDIPASQFLEVTNGFIRRSIVANEHSPIRMTLGEYALDLLTHMGTALECREDDVDRWR